MNTIYAHIKKSIASTLATLAKISKELCKMCGLVEN